MKKKVYIFFILFVIFLLGYQLVPRNYKLQDFYGVWTSNDGLLQVYIQDSKIKNKVNLYFSDKSIFDGDSLNTNFSKDGLLEVIESEKDTTYSFRMLNKNKLRFSFSSISANNNRTPNLSAPIELRKDYSSE